MKLIWLIGIVFLLWYNIKSTFRIALSVKTTKYSNNRSFWVKYYKYKKLYGNIGFDSTNEILTFGTLTDILKTFLENSKKMANINSEQMKKK